MRDRISGILGSLNTVTLATVDAPTGAPCAAAVYFAHDESLDLYFISSKTTVHGRNMLADPRVAGTVHDEHQEWSTLRGLQLVGRARPVTALELPGALRVFGKKHRFLNLLDAADNPVALAGALAKATFWKLETEWFRLIDNGRGFGFHEEYRPKEAGASGSSCGA